ncbi:MAG TPA: DNA polymerase III subunit delta, partial [Planctomycetaceae bacterium]
ARRGTPLPAAVKAAGVFPKDQADSVEYLKRLGPKAAGRFFEHLAQADAALRGQGRMPERIILERLLVRLAGVK